MKTYGQFLEQPGSYEITQLPEAGSYEYIYKNEDLLLKVDQFGILTAQIDPPVGEALLKREKRETASPARVYFQLDGKVYHNFDGYQADSLRITFCPQAATYRLRFGQLEVITQLVVACKGARFVMQTRFRNHGESRELKLLTCTYPYVSPLLMAPWDKPEWYTRTQYLPEEDAFLTTKFSVAGNREERRFFTVVADQPFDGVELSSERLQCATKNFALLPDALSPDTGNVLYAFEQCISGLKTCSLGAGEDFVLTQCFAAAKEENQTGPMLAASRQFLAPGRLETEKQDLEEKYQALFSVKQVKTNQPVFDRFVNGFLPLELDWVSALDRGWPTGMRGVRDAANDFQGLIAYDSALCRAVIENIFSTQRSDGWYPRQVPFGGSGKFDLRSFVDSACFFTEFVYDYLAYTGDYALLEKEYGYYDRELRETGLQHLIKGVEYLLAPENTGKHGLVKLQGGDWLDCLGGAGKEGIGESVMVSCQLRMSVQYLCQILEALGREVPEAYPAAVKRLGECINAAAWNEQGFYNGVYTDRREWIFSDQDPDGEKRVYVPTNAYAIISGVASGKEEPLLANIRQLRTSNGYQLYNTPFGAELIEGIGKLGTGDFQPWFAENASVYNHGSQGFLLRALAKAGQYELLEDVLGFMLPIYEDKHPAGSICAAPYAITNCYHLVPGFYGRAGFSFLTGSVAMIERAVYQWMFGVDFSMEHMVLCPCIPESYRDSEITVPYGTHRVQITYHGFGAQPKKVLLGKGEVPLASDGRTALIPKAQLQEDVQIQVFF